MGIERREDKGLPPALSFKARIFVALVGISSVTSLIFGLVLYYFAQDRLVHAENTLLRQRSQTANSGAQDFLEGLRDPEDKTLPPPPDYAEELVRAVADPTGLEVLYVGPDMEPLAARDGLGDSLDPRKAYGGLDNARTRGDRLIARGRGQARVERGTLGVRGGVAAHGLRRYREGSPWSTTFPKTSSEIHWPTYATASWGPY